MSKILQEPDKNSYRIAIIGGGPGGLVAAYFLERKSNKNIQITLFEASDRIGGKIVSRHFESAPVLYEAGVSELYDYSQLGLDPLRRLVKDLKLPTVKMFGRTIVLGDRIMRDAEDIRRHFGKKTLNSIQAFRKRCRSQVSLKDYYDGGWPDDNKHPLIKHSFQSILSKVPNETARHFLKVAVHSDLATEPHLTHGLYGIENCLMDISGYIQLYSIEGGIERLPQALQSNISAQIQLNCPVTRVEKTLGNTYRVFFRNNGQTESNDFDFVIVALPNYWIPSIEWGGKRLEEAMYKHYAYYDYPAHYLRISILFQQPFWRQRIADSYFQLDTFGGCCVYDESSRYDSGKYGVLSWLLGGRDAMIMSNFEDNILINKALDSLPQPLQDGKNLFLEGRVHRWVGTVNAQPGGYPIKGIKSRHLPEPQEHPGLFVVGDYLFDSTINGVIDSAEIATDLVLNSLKKQKPQVALAAVNGNRESDSLKKDYFDYYDGKRSHKESFKEYFDENYITKLISFVWGLMPPYRLLDTGSANGMAVAALAKVGVDAWGIENNRYIHQQTNRKLRHKNLLGDVRDIPFPNNYFDFVYDTCLCYVPDCDIDKAIGEIHRVSRYGVFFDAITSDVSRQVVKNNDLFYGVKSLHSLEKWSERFLCNGFQLAIKDPQILEKVWKFEKKVNAGKPWFPTRESMRYCFFTK